MFGFGGKQQQQQQQPGNNGNQMPNNQQQNTQQQNNQQAQNGQNGQNGQNTQSNEPANPLDVYSKLFDNDNSNPDTPPTFSIDPKQMDQITSSMDFMRGVDQELMQKATQGDSAALLQLMNQVGRNAYRASIEHGGVLTDKFVGAYSQHAMKGVGGTVRQELTQSALSKVPNAKHPVVKKQLSQLASMFAKQHPDATAEEIAQMSQDYILTLGKALNPQAQDQGQGNQQQSAERNEEYWNDFFEQQGNS